MKLKLIYGIRDLQDETKKLMEDTISARGGEIVSTVSRWNKTAVLHSVDDIRGEKEAEVVLLISHQLDMNDPFNLAELISCQEAIPTIKIILVIDKDQQGTSFLNDLYKNGLFHAVYSEDSDENVIAELVINGRTAADTRRYYGVGNEAFVRGIMSVEKSLEYVLKAKEEGSTYAERLIWIKEKVNNEITFREIMNRLPDEVKEELADDPRFESYIQEYLKARAEEEAELERQRQLAKSLEERERELQRQEAKARAGMTDARSAIARALRRMVIGVVGTEHRVGCTHHAVLMAHYLHKEGYKVAVAEYTGMDNKILGRVTTCLGASETDGVYVYNGVDYYPDFSLSMLPDLNTRNYNFVIIDFGVFKEEIKEEFGRCIQQIVVCGSKPWELKRIENVFSVLGGDRLVDANKRNELDTVSEPVYFDDVDRQLSCYNYLFAPVELCDQRKIRQAMRPFQNIYFTEYITNPFLGERCDALASIMRDYMIDVKKSTREGTRNMETGKAGEEIKDVVINKIDKLKDKIGGFFS